jgi:hypothetical protein
MSSSGALIPLRFKRFSCQDTTVRFHYGYEN